MLTRRLFLASTAAPLLWRARQLHAETPRRGGVLVVAADTEPRNLNPALVASNGVFYVASKVIEPLAEMAYGEPGLEPRLALAWEGSADGRSLLLRLRPGVRFHDGTSFTSADVAYCALELWKKHQNLGRVVFKDLEAVETPDPATAILRFSAPTPAQLIANALPALTAVVPRRLFEGTDPLANPHNQKLVGTGPFRFVEHRPGQYYRLERNPDYWDAPKPWLDGIVYRVLPDRGAIAAALESGEIHLAAFSAVPLADMQRLAKLPGIAVIEKGYEGITYQLVVEINHRRKELADVRVRRAIAHAIDRDFVVRTIFLGWAQPASGPIPRFDGRFYTADVPAYPYDPRRAEALLDEAGLRRGADGVRFALDLLPAPWFEQTRQMGEYLRQALKAIGIEARLVVKDPAGHQKAVYTDHAFDLAIGSPVYRNDPAISTTILYESGLPPGVPFSNQYGWAEPAMDEVIRTAARAIDPAERAALYRRFQTLAMEHLPIVPVVEFTFLTVARTNVREVASNPRWAVSNWADCWLAA
ncbi:MAG: ABC transporter substrate-binding protein [Geminicoccaceae bacterium]|nr:ABC transporter substrate-binding protein [Geminicoccaceae bacterium]MCX8100578.1 ABC transporter substrate-binding protein [Geminicoccaceae bacterium]MDW8369285.1 ABC transporter substrate-binding protein [Geminicoccaceae bacterium]